MLPVTLQFIIAMFAHAINEQMARRVEYLQEEIHVLKERLAAETGSTRMAFTPAQRRRLAIKGKALTPEERRDCCLRRNRRSLASAHGGEVPPELGDHRNRSRSAVSTRT
jgi:hypothetical protein